MDEILKFSVTFACQIFLEMHLRNYLMKKAAAWSHNHCCHSWFSTKTFTKKPSIFLIHFFTLNLYSFGSSHHGEQKKIELGKDLSFSSALLTLIKLFCWKKECRVQKCISGTCMNLSRDASLELVCVQFSVLFSTMSLTCCYVVIIFIRYGAPDVFLK